jgi:hypothetical protein
MSNVIPKPFTPDLIANAIGKLREDPGAVFTPEILILLRDVYQNDTARWSRYRLEVKKTGVVSIAEFDRQTKIRRKSDHHHDDFFPEVIIEPNPVDGAELLNDITTALARYVIADRETLRAAALWAVFTWFIDVVQVAPIANITAPEKRCGKTILLSALGKLVYRPLQLANIATAALFRSIEMWSPTLLTDEVDTFLAANDEIRGILNAGHTRESAFVVRCEGEDHTPTRFNLWGAKVLCGIGKISDTLADRSIPLRLRRRYPGENVEQLRHSDAAIWESLRSRTARFACDNAEAVAKTRPTPIDGLNDRANDCWEPLLAISEVAGGDWPRLARHAAIALHGLETEPLSIGAELLEDVRAAFDLKRHCRMHTADLLDALTADDEAPWATWNKGKPLTARQLATKLKEFGIKSKDIRIGEVKKGYEYADLTDAFARYLPSNVGISDATPLQPSGDGA